MSPDTRRINIHQKKLYEEYERDSVTYFMKLYESELGYFQSIASGKRLKVLDVGGGSGFFAKAVKDYFNGSCDIYVVDNTMYDSWDELKQDVNFIQASACDVADRFESNYFDIIFVNRVFHHLVRETYSATIEGFSECLTKIKHVLGNKGRLFIISDVG